jgi:hypothetical protein
MAANRAAQSLRALLLEFLKEPTGDDFFLGWMLSRNLLCTQTLRMHDLPILLRQLAAIERVETLP